MPLMSVFHLSPIIVSNVISMFLSIHCSIALFVVVFSQSMFFCYTLPRNGRIHVANISHSIILYLFST